MTSSVRACPALAGVAVGRLVMGPMAVLRALQRGVSFFCWLFASSGEALSLFHRFVRGCRADASPSRSRHALEGAHTGSSSWDFDRSPRPGASRSSARVVLGQSGACLRPPRPSGVAVVDSSSTFAGALLYWGASAWFLPLGCLLSRLPTGWRLAVFRAVAGCRAGIDGCRFSSPLGVEVGSFSYTLAFSRLTSVLSRCQILAWLVSWRWLVLGWCLCLA